MTSSPSTTEPHPPAGWEEAWGEFADWAAGRLGLLLDLDGAEFTLGPQGRADSSSEPAPSGIGSALFRRRRRKAEPSDAEIERYDSAHGLASALLQRLANEQRPPDLAPREQPTSLHELAPAVLQAYTVDNGGVHIAGCTFEEVPFVRLSTATEATPPAFRHELYQADGSPVDEATAQSLGLRAVMDFDHHPHADWHPPETACGSVSGIVWAKYVRGQLQVTIGEASFRAPFEGWAATLKAPPLLCPETGFASYHFTQTDAGQIAAAQQVAPCEESGRRLLVRDLVRCQMTGLRVATDLCDLCPVSGKPSLRAHFSTCPRCSERVSLAALSAGVCTACRRTRRVTPADPSLAAILAAYPELEQLGRWRLAETSHCYLLQGSRFLKHYLLVFDRQTLAVRRALQLLPLGRTRELTVTQQQQLFGTQDR